MSVAHESLAALQTVDTEIASLKRTAKQLPEEAQAAKRSAEAAEREAEQARTLARDAQRFVDQRNLDLQRTETAINRLEAQSLQLKTPTEFETMQRQIVQKREEASALETKILEGMEMVDRALAAIPDKEAHARTLAAKAAAAAERAKTEVKKGGERLQVLSREWSERSAQVPADLLPRYVLLRDRHGGQAVATIAPDGMCQGCFMLVTRARATQALAGEAVACNNCERYLIVV